MTASGIDRLLAEPERWLAPRARVALLANQASLTEDGRTTVEALLACRGLDLCELLSAEHGWSGFEDDAKPVFDRRHVEIGLPVHSLYGPRRLPETEFLGSVDAVVVDIQEVGVRCYTYATTVALLLEAAAQAGTRVIICDRPNLLGPKIIGPPLDSRYRSFLGYLDVPFQHGLTLGELASWHSATVLDRGVDLTVIPTENARRIDGASGPWIPPSPGLPSREAVALYPGLVLLEGTNLSEGRGTPLPFQVLGAPWLDGYRLARELTALRLPGLLFRPLSFRPESGKLVGSLCHGVQLHLSGETHDALGSAIAILSHLSAYSEFRWVENSSLAWSQESGAGKPWHEPKEGLLIDYLVGTDGVRRIIDGAPSEPIEEGWRAARRAFREGVGPHRLYPLS